MTNNEFRLDIPATPLEGVLEMDRPMQDLLGPDFLAGVYSALRFTKEQTLPVFNAAGRNYYLPLARRLGPYDALQIGGGGNFDIGITSTGDVQDSIVDPQADEKDWVVVPPSEDAGLFTGQTMFYEDGACIERVDRDPIGSYTARSANQKIENTQTAFNLLSALNAGVITPRYVGKFMYDIADQFGDPQTAILLLVPSLGRRFDSTLLLPLNAMRAGKAPTPGEKFVENLVPYYQAILVPRFYAIGRGIETAHAAGLTHHQLTPGNTDALVAPDKVLVPYITDWGTMKVPSVSEEKRAQALDMTLAVQAASSMLKRLVRQEVIDEKTAADLALDTVRSMLGGYHESRGTLDGKTVYPVDAVNVAASHYDLEKILDLVEMWLA